MNRVLQRLSVLAVVVAVVGMMATDARAQDDSRAHSQVYGFAMMDMGYNSIAIDPDWFDVQRPTKLPAFEDQFGDQGNTFFSVRQTRLGVKSWFPTDLGEVQTQFEFEMFGVGPDAGQTTMRLRHAYGQLGKWGAGQTWSPFMDIEVFPNTVEYWGPNGMVFFRNVQLRYMPIQGDTRMTIALERPGASADGGVHSDILDEEDLVARFPVPDLSAEYRQAFSKGYVELAGIVRRMEWEDNDGGPTDLSDGVTGWGLNLTSNLKFGGSDVDRLGVVYGEGVQNYMNDAPVDVATEANPGDPTKPILGVALPMTGISAALDHSWNEKWASSFCYSRLDIDNSDGQSPDAFKSGQYALANIQHYPAKNVMVVLEGGWIDRVNNEPFTPGGEAFKEENLHVQLSFKYNFSMDIGNSN
jgi:hypothetical protein